MNTSLKNLLLSAALLTSAMLVAQDKGGKGSKRTPEERAQEQTAQMTKDLGLSADQQTTVGSINARYARLLADVKASTPNEDARKEKAKPLKAQRDGELKQVLTADQFTRMLKLREDKHKEKKDSKTEEPAPAKAKPHNE